jgi:hypothetical protein
MLGVMISFPGQAISAHGVDGPWNLSEVTILSGGDDALVEDSEVDWHQTQAHLAGHFEPPDSDVDGVPDAIDNCPAQNNLVQDDVDSDGIGDSCDDDLDGDGITGDLDCSDYDPMSTSIPPDIELEFLGPADLQMSDATPVSGAGTVYDVVRGDLADMSATQGLGSATCLASSLVSNALTDATMPSPGSGFFYLARARNSCGQSAFSVQPSLTASCP